MHIKEGLGRWSYRGAVAAVISSFALSMGCAAVAITEVIAAPPVVGSEVNDLDAVHLEIDALRLLEIGVGGMVLTAVARQGASKNPGSEIGQ